MTKIFPLGVALLDLGAAAVYLWKGQPRLAFVWLCYALASAALAGVKG